MKYGWLLYSIFHPLTQAARLSAFQRRVDALAVSVVFSAGLEQVWNQHSTSFPKKSWTGRLWKAWLHKHFSGVTSSHRSRLLPNGVQLPSKYSWPSLSRTGEYTVQRGQMRVYFVITNWVLDEELECPKRLFDSGGGVKSYFGNAQIDSALLEEKNLLAESA